MLVSFIFSHTILNADQAANRISESSVSTQITNSVNQQLAPLTDGQFKVPRLMIKQLVHDKVKQAYTDGKVEFAQSDVQPNVTRLIKDKLPNLSIGSWLSDKLAQHVSPLLVKRLNHQFATADNQRVAYQIYQARQINQFVFWLTLALTILLGIWLILTTNVWQSLINELWFTGVLLVIISGGLSLAGNWYLEHELQQLRSLTLSIKPLLGMATYQIGIAGGLAVLLSGLCWLLVKNLKPNGDQRHENK
ncbi:hypothetical protein ACYATO_03490 [Lactobacillaceae bacterium Melli_B3]